jgi:hypothetical protein
MTPRNHEFLHQESISIILAVLISFFSPKATETSPIFNTGHPTPSFPLTSYLMTTFYPSIPFEFLIPYRQAPPLDTSPPSKKCAVAPLPFHPFFGRAENPLSFGPANPIYLISKNFLKWSPSSQAYLISPHFGWLPTKFGTWPGVSPRCGTALRGFAKGLMGRRGRLKKRKEEATLRRIYYLVNDVVRYRDYLYDRFPSKLYI